MVNGKPFNHFFYVNIFELLLRLRANYLWVSFELLIGYALSYNMSSFFSARNVEWHVLR